MDRIIHNESLVICSILYLMVNDISDISELDLLAVLSVDQATRKRINKYDNYNNFVQYESRFDKALNRKFLEMQPIILNALTMMMMAGLIEDADNNKLAITDQGCKMVYDSCEENNHIMIELRDVVERLVGLRKDVKTSTLYKDLKIAL